MKRTLAAALMAVILVAAPAAADRSPWKWDKALTGDDAGVHLLRPASLFWDAAEERYYVVDTMNSRLASYDREGVFLKQLRAGGQLGLPVSMGRDPRGGIWVVDRKLNALQYVDLKAQKVEAKTVKYKDGATVFLDRLFVDPAGTIYVLDRSRGGVLRLGPDLSVTTELRGEEKAAFVDFKVRSDGVWALDQRNRALVVFGADGSVSRKIGLKGDLEFPVSFDVDEHGLIYVLDRHAGAIRVFDRGGEFRYGFLEVGSARGQLYFPSQLLFDGLGRLCVANEGNGRVDIYRR
ncbi:MAG: NHL repeat-containing protein [Thermodesulfobacteriota bacterium]